MTPQHLLRHLTYQLITGNLVVKICHHFEGAPALNGITFFEPADMPCFDIPKCAASCDPFRRPDSYCSKKRKRR